jgi:protein ImuA
LALFLFCSSIVSPWNVADMTKPTALSFMRNRALVASELRHLLPRMEGFRATKALPFGLSAIDRHLPHGGLTGAALHEIVADQGALSAAFGFVVALLARTCPSSRVHPIIFVVPAYGLRHYGRPHGHGLNALGLDPGCLILVETAHRRETLWAMEEALHSGAPAAVAGVIDKLDLKLSQRLQLVATDAGLPLLLLRSAQNLESSAAATRWRVGTAEAARDRFGLFARPKWHLQLERCRNGRPGEWMVEYDHVAHCFSLSAALADPAFASGAGEKNLKQSCRF